MDLAVIATGPPGSGKSTTLADLGAGYAVVAEAATEVNLELLGEGVTRPETAPDFLTRIVALQRQRRLAERSDRQVHDRSVFCTLALARYLDLPVPPSLDDEIADVHGLFASRVLFFEPFGIIENTAARRISYDQAVEFGEVHRRVYLDHGFELISVPKMDPPSRAALVRSLIDDASQATR